MKEKEIFVNFGVWNFIVSSLSGYPICDIFIEKEGREIFGDKLSKEDIVPLKQVWKYIYPEIVTAQVGLSHEVFFFS